MRVGAARSEQTAAATVRMRGWRARQAAFLATAAATRRCVPALRRDATGDRYGSPTKPRAPRSSRPPASQPGRAFRKVRAGGKLFAPTARLMQNDDLLANVTEVAGSKV